MGSALKIRDDLDPPALRALARRERDGRMAARLYAIAHALEGASRAEAARLAGMERQALRDAVVRYNAEGLAGLYDRPKGRPPRRLTEAEETALVAAIVQGPDRQVDGVSAWTRADLCRWLQARFGESRRTRIPLEPLVIRRGWVEFACGRWETQVRPDEHHAVRTDDGS